MSPTRCSAWVAERSRLRALSGATLALPLLTGLMFLVALTDPAWPATTDTAACIRDSRCHRTLAVAHRVKGFGAPENSAAAVARAVAAGMAVVEIDLRASKDGELFLLHDRKLDRTTNLRGLIETTDSAALAQARLENGEPLPRFKDVYELARARTMLAIAFKVDAVEAVAAWIHAHGAFDDLIFFVNTGEEMRSAAEAKRRHPRMIVMVRLLDRRVTVESTRAIFGQLPEIFHTDRVRACEVARLQALGVKVWMNAVPWEGYIEPVKSLAVGWILGTKLDFILTDTPVSTARRIGAR